MTRKTPPKARTGGTRRAPAAGTPDDASTGETRSAAPYVPATRSLTTLATAVQACRGCDLYKTATQAVFGEGPRAARVMFVGEQPGDQEDQQGAPFVGPAGALLDKALAEAGIPRDAVYVTNAVKHFKWEPRGKRRIHRKPRVSEIRACRPWLDAELRLVAPTVVVCLGATAAQALLGAAFRLTAQRGTVVTAAVGDVVATIHPSAVLRAPDSEARREAYASLVADLRVVARLIGNS